MANRMLKAIAFAGALAVAAPALAAKPAAKKPAAKTAPAAQRPWEVGIPIETDCFAMKLPGNLVPTQRIKSANKPYIGTWGFYSAPNANLKVWVRCNPAKKVPLKTAFHRSVKKMSSWVKSMRLSDSGFHFFKDDKGRPAGQVFFSGITKVLKNKKSVAARHMFSRTFIQFPGRNLRVSITVAAAAPYAKEIVEITSHILGDFEVVDAKDKHVLKTKVKTKQAAHKKKATRVR